MDVEIGVVAIGLNFAKFASVTGMVKHVTREEWIVEIGGFVGNTEIAVNDVNVENENDENVVKVLIGRGNESLIRKTNLIRKCHLGVKNVDVVVKSVFYISAKISSFFELKKKMLSLR